MSGERSSKKGWRRVVSLFKRQRVPMSPGPLNFMPLDILLEIVEDLHVIDILHIAKTSSQMHHLLLPRLYRLVFLASTERCRPALSMLEGRRDICGHIRKLVVRPKSRYPRRKPDDPDDLQGQVWVCYTIARLAPHMTGLETFDWDGPEIAGDALWRALKQSCPGLKRVFCTVGSNPMDSGLPLFQFENLTAFSLSSRLDQIKDSPLSSRERLPSQLWHMVLECCPNLEDLTICGVPNSCRYFDVREITRGHWPKLRALALDLSVPMEDDPDALSAEALRTFLAAHPTLERLCLYPHATQAGPSQEFPDLFTPGSLPILTSFVGVHYQIGTIPFPESLHALDVVSSPMVEEDLIDFIPHLPRYTALTSLDLRLNCPAPPVLFVACRTVVHLRLIFEPPVFFELEYLAKDLRHLRRLRTLLLSRRDPWSGSSTCMLRAALLLLGYNHGLEEINLSYTDLRRQYVCQEGNYVVRGRYMHLYEQRFRANGRKSWFRRRHDLEMMPPKYGGAERYEEIGELERVDSLKKVVHFSQWSQARSFVF